MRRSRSKMMVLLVALVLFAGTVALGCGGGKETEPEKLIPAGSNLIAQANLQGILASDGLASIFDAIPKSEDDPQSLDQLLDEAIAEAGVDFRRFSELVFFADVLREEEFLGLIAHGTFEEAVIIAALEKLDDGPAVISDYKGHQLYTFDDGPDDGAVLAFLEEDNLVVGSVEAVHAVIDVQEGDRDQVSGALRDAFNDLGPGLFRIEVEFPADDLQDQLVHLGDIPFLGEDIENLPAALGALQELELIGFALAQNGQILIPRINLDFGSEDSARSVGNLLDGLVKLGAGLVPDPEVADLLNQIQVEQEKSRLTIRLEVAAAELGGLVNSIVAPSRTEVAVNAPQKAELDQLQAAIDTLMADKGLIFVASPDVAVNDFTTVDLDPGSEVAYLSDYLRQLRTKFFYCWDDQGRMIMGMDLPLPCPQKAIPVPVPIAPGEEPETAIPGPRVVGLGVEVSIMPTRLHVPEGQPVAYSSTPPTSGDHWANWADCGFYEDGLPDERITHNLEHGNIVVSYNLTGPQALDDLQDVWDGIGLAPQWGIARFYDEIPEGTVAIAAWGRLDTMAGIDAARIGAFFEAFTGYLGPERIPC